MMWSLRPLKNLTFIFLTWNTQKGFVYSTFHKQLYCIPDSSLNLPNWNPITVPLQEMKPLITSYCTNPLPRHIHCGVACGPSNSASSWFPSWFNAINSLLPFWAEQGGGEDWRKTIFGRIFQSGSIKVAKGSIYNHHGNKQHYYTVDLWVCKKSFQPTNMN